MLRPDFSQKLAGLLVPVFALREEGGLGIGDTLSMRCAIDFCAARSFGVLQILPINETGGDHSPYNAISSVALDPVLLHLSPDWVPGLLAEHLVELTPSDLRERLNTGPVHYVEVKRVKLALLERAFHHFNSANDAQKGELENFKKQAKAWLPGYTLFRALLGEHQGDARWPLWAPEWRTLASAERVLVHHPHGEAIRQRRDFYAYVQWVAYTQWREVKAYASSKQVKLMGDIPFGVSRYSADVWADQPLFDLDWSGGAPPESHFKGDPFTEKWGQNWGIPLYNWTAHERENYAWWRQRVVCTCEVFHTFRIDHVLGFFRVYAFPWTPERNTEFVDLDETQTKSRCGGRLPGFVPRADEPEEFAILNEQDGEKLLRIILEAAGDSIVVAEDLGMVPDYVRPLLQRLGIPGFTIPPFERDEKDRSYTPARKFPAINLVTYATHDHSPIAQFYGDLVEHWTGPNGHEGWLEVCRLMEFLGKHGEDAPRTFTRELHLLLIEKLLLTPCWLAVFMITDLLGTHQRFNSPGSIGSTNWSERLEHSLDRYSASPQFGALIQRTAELIRLTQRSPRR